MSDTVEQPVQFHELCELLHISTHRPRLTYKIRKSQVSVGEHVLDSAQATTPAWKLMPAEMSAELDRIDNQVGRLLDQYTQRFRTAPTSTEDDSDSGQGGFMIRGLYLVPLQHAENLLRQLDALHHEMRACVTRWVRDTDRFREAIKKKMANDAIFELVKENIPDLNTMLASARIDYVTIPFGRAIDQLSRVGRDSFLAQARSRTTDLVEQVTRQLIAGPRQELAEAITNLRQLIEAEGRVSTKSIAPIRRALEKLKMFEFVADARLLEQMDNLGRTLDTIVPSEQNPTTSADNGLLDALRQTAETALDEARVQEQYQVATNRLLRLRRPVVARP